MAPIYVSVHVVFGDNVVLLSILEKLDTQWQSDQKMEQVRMCIVTPTYICTACKNV